MISSEKSRADAPTVLTWNIVSCCRDRGDRRTSDTAFDDQLLRVTEWANRTLRGDDRRGHDDDDDDFAAAYDQMYSAALHGGRNADEQLYRRLRGCVANHLNDAVVPALERASGNVELMAVARRAYTDFGRAADRLADACAYLDVVMHRRGRGVEPVRAMARSLFRDMLLQRRRDVDHDPALKNDACARRTERRPDGHVDLMSRLEDAVVQSAHVHLWAGHECADAAFCGRTVLAAFADSASAVGLSLVQRLRDRFLDEADRRLRAFARSADNSPDGYAEAAARTIDAEAAVALRYGGHAVARAVASRAAVLLVAERRAFVVHSDAGLCHMMDTGRDADAVAKVYALLTRLPDAFGSQVVAKAVACCAGRQLHGLVTGHHYHEVEDGDDGVTSTAVRTDHAHFVDRVMWFLDAMDEYLRRAFANDAVVARAVEHHVQRAFDCCKDAPQHLARHISDLLTGPKAPDAVSLDRAFSLLWYLDDDALDMFELIYRYYLICRLAMDQGRQTDDGREEKAYRALVARCGRSRSRRLRLLLDDVRASSERLAGDRHHGGLGDRDRWPAGLRVVAVNRHSWPLPVWRTAFRYPPAADAAFRRYRELYATAHHGRRRRLTFVPWLCTADVVAARRDGRRVRFTVTMYQAAVLLLFNGRARVASRAHLRDRTGIPEPELRLTLESLTRDGVLRAVDRGHAYRLHRDYRDADAEDDGDEDDDDDDGGGADDEDGGDAATADRTIGFRYRPDAGR